MKKLFLIITIIFTTKIFYSADNSSSFNVNFKVTKGYSHLISLENLYRFIEEIITWDKYRNEFATIESYNSKETKKLIITFFHIINNKEPIKVTYWLDNNNQDPEFEEKSIWGNPNYKTYQTIHALFNRARHNVSTPQKKYLDYLEETLLCTKTTKINFEPTIDLRTAQRLDSFTTKAFPLIRQRPTDEDYEDIQDLQQLRSDSPSPENPFKK